MTRARRVRWLAFTGVALLVIAHAAAADLLMRKWEAWLLAVLGAAAITKAVLVWHLSRKRRVPDENDSSAARD